MSEETTETAIVNIYTTAPESYDYRGTSEAFAPARIQGRGIDSGNPLRVFTTDPHTAKYQIPRYQSGLYIATLDLQEALELTAPADGDGA